MDDKKQQDQQHTDDSQSSAEKPSDTLANVSSQAKSAARAGGALLSHLWGYTGKMTSSLFDVAKSGSAIPLMYTDNWLKDLYIKSIDPERLRAMADAGAFLKDARQVAGLNLQDLAEALGLKDTELLVEVENGRATLPFDMILRIASLIARHDPIPFILKFVRTYNPDLEKRLDAWGITLLPKQFERERRFNNLMRKHDVLRNMSDAEFERFIHYQESALAYTLEVMSAEKAANQNTPDNKKPRQ